MPLWVREVYVQPGSVGRVTVLPYGLTVGLQGGFTEAGLCQSRKRENGTGNFE